MRFLFMHVARECSRVGSGWSRGGGYISKREADQPAATFVFTDRDHDRSCSSTERARARKHASHMIFSSISAPSSARVRARRMFTHVHMHSNSVIHYGERRALLVVSMR